MDFNNGFEVLTPEISVPWHVKLYCFVGQQYKDCGGTLITIYHTAYGYIQEDWDTCTSDIYNRNGIKQYMYFTWNCVLSEAST